MPRLQASISVVRSPGDVDFLRDRVAGRPAVALPSTGVAAGQEAPQPLRFLAGPADPAVDRLRADGAQAGLDSEAQPSGDPLRRPAFAEPVRDTGRKPGIRPERRLALAARHVRPSATCGRYASLSSALRRSSREMVDAARPSALPIARSDRPSAIRPASRSLSSAVRWEYPDMATPFSVSRRTDTSSAPGVALHEGTHRSPPLSATVLGSDFSSIWSNRTRIEVNLLNLKNNVRIKVLRAIHQIGTVFRSGEQRPGENDFGGFAAKAVLSPTRITLENEGKIRPQPDREKLSSGASGGGDGPERQPSPVR